MNQNQVVTNNMVMNTFLLINPNNEEMKIQTPPPQQTTSIDDLMTYFTNRYKNILPQRMDANLHLKSIHFSFEGDQVIELMNQMEILIQLLIQTLLFSKKSETKSKAYNLLRKIYDKKCMAASSLEHMPVYEVPLSKFKAEDDFNYTDMNSFHPYGNSNPLSIYTKPQLSIFQTPILEFIGLFIDLNGKDYKKEDIQEILKYLEPIIQKNWIPVFSGAKEGAKFARTKFNHVDDSLLLIGLNKFGSKKFELIQNNFLPDKKVPEIKHRYKNLICLRAADNKIKRWKVLQFVPLTEEEKKKIQKAHQWFGSVEKNYPLVAKYFLTDRSPEFIKSELEKSEKLLQKRKKYAKIIASTKLEDAYPRPLYELMNIIYSTQRIQMPKYVYQNERGMEEEKEMEESNSEGSFEHATIEQQDENIDKIRKSGNKINIDEENFAFRADDAENFEKEELNFSSDESTLSDESMMRMTQNMIENGASENKMFKKIGFEIFEYEEI